MQFPPSLSVRFASSCFRTVRCAAAQFTALGFLFAFVCSAALATTASPTATAASTEQSVEIPFDPVFTAADDAHRADLVGIVFGVDGRRAAHVEIDLVRNVMPGYMDLFLRDADSATRTVAHLRTDERGAFVQPVEFGASYALFAHDGTTAIARADACTAGEHVQLRLAKPASWHVRVMQRSTRAPLAGFTLEARRDLCSGLPQFGTVTRVLSSAVTDAEGRAILTGLPPGVVELALEPSTGTASIGTMRVQAGETRSFDVWADGRVQRVRGVVFDPDNRPVANAEVARDVEFRDPWHTDDTGHFTIPRLWSVDNITTLFARTPSFGIGEALTMTTDAHELSFEIHLERSASVHGRFVDVDRKPVAHVNVAIVESPSWQQQGSLVRELRASVSREDGTFDVPDVLLNRQHLLVAVRDGFALGTRELASSSSDGVQIDVHDIVLHDASALSGTVASPDFLPQSRILVCFQGKPTERDLLLGGPGADTMPETILCAAWTDSLGRFTIPRVPEGKYAVYAADEFTDIRTPTLDLPRERQAPTWRVRMPVSVRTTDSEAKLSGSLTGRALFQDGTPCAGAVVTIVPDDPGLTRRGSPSVVNVDPSSQRLPITTFTNEHGDFAFEHVPPTSAIVVVQLWAGLEGQSALIARRVFEPQSAAELRDIRVVPVVAVHGRVVDPNAVKGRTWLVRASSAIHAFATACVETDTTGKFTFYLEENGAMTVTVLPLNDDAGQPKSSEQLTPQTATIVPNLTATHDEIVIRIPERR